MGKKLLKGGMKFWQEIVFLVFAGLLFTQVTAWVVSAQSMDMWDVLLFCLLIPLFTCLIGQLFWKNRSLGIALSILLGLSSFLFVLMSLYFIATTNAKMAQAITMFLLGLFLFISSITMFMKYLKDSRDCMVKSC